MGSSKKHKKHKDKDKEREKRSLDESSSTSFSDQKPLRLVLKVGSASTTVDRSPSISSVQQYQEPPSEDASFYNDAKSSSEFGSSKKLKKKKSKKKHKKHSHHHHHHHHHKHKSTCSHHSKSRDVSNDSIDSSKLLSTSNSMDVDPLPQDVPMDVPPIDPVLTTDTQNDQNVQPLDPITISPPKSPQKVSYKSSAKPFYHNLFTYMLRQLEKRDTNAFFAWPVTDLIAPGYSTIIKHPMDFYTIRKKIEQRSYETIAEMKADVKLMCDNAMTYNQPDTIYYKTARKIWHYARDKVFSRDNINEAKSQASVSNVLLPSIVQGEPPSTLPIVTESTALGDITNASTSTDAGQVENMDTETDDEEAAAILAQAEKAAAAAAQRLSYARPQGAHFSFLRQKEDGSTTLAIVGAPIQAERALSINDLVGKLPEGTPYLPSYSEPECNKVKPVESVSTLPFSSYLPSLDSSKSKLTPEETSLLLSAYGDEEIGIPYAHSVLEFAGDSQYLIAMVDNLLEILTQGQHSKVITYLKNHEANNEKANENNSESNESNSANDGKDANNKDEISSKLEETQNLLTNLESIQRKRLSSTTKPTQPSLEEVEMAAKLSNKLAQMIGTCTAPIDVTDIKSIRKAMGVHVKDS